MSVRRDWTDAHEKLEREHRACRVGHGCRGRTECAHVIGRKYDAPLHQASILYVHPDDVVPLCTHHHRLYDAHDLELLPHLLPAEQARAALHVGLVRALARTTRPTVSG